MFNRHRQSINCPPNWARLIQTYFNVISREYQCYISIISMLYLDNINVISREYQCYISRISTLYLENINVISREYQCYISRISKKQPKLAKHILIYEQESFFFISSPKVAVEWLTSTSYTECSVLKFPSKSWLIF